MTFKPSRTAPINMKPTVPKENDAAAPGETAPILQILERKQIKAAPKNDEGVNVVAIGYWGVLGLAFVLAAYAVFDCRNTHSRIDLPFWWDVVSGLLGLAGAFKISAGAFLTGKRTHALFHPYIDGRPSDHKEMVTVVHGMRDLMVAASDAAIRGTIWLLIAFLMVLCKPAVDEFAHAPISSNPAQTESSKLRTKKPPSKVAAPTQDSASQPGAPSPTPNCQDSSCPR